MINGWTGVMGNTVIAELGRCTNLREAATFMCLKHSLVAVEAQVQQLAFQQLGSRMISSLSPSLYLVPRICFSISLCHKDLRS